MRKLLLVMVATAVLAIAAAVVTSDPEDRFAVAAVVGGIGVAAAGVASLVLLRLDATGRRLRGRRPARARALRRGLGIGAIIGILAALRVVDGLTPLTALFVVLAFALAEYILSARSTASRSGPWD